MSLIVCRIGVPARHHDRRVDARGREEDQEDEHADREHHEQRSRPSSRRTRKVTTAASSSASSAGRARRERRRRSTFSASTVSTIVIPGAIATARPRVEQALAVLDDRAPARLRRLDADREERQRRLGQHRRSRSSAAAARSRSRPRSAGSPGTPAGSSPRPGRPPPRRTPSRAATETSPADRTEDVGHVDEPDDHQSGIQRLPAVRLRARSSAACRSGAQAAPSPARSRAGRGGTPRSSPSIAR